jgi:transcription-repair coupling factor (superfamily II helicase)
LDIELRLGLYKRIANMSTDAQLEEIAVEMIDRFGKLHKEVENLLDIMKIKH